MGNKKHRGKSSDIRHNDSPESFSSIKYGYYLKNKSMDANPFERHSYSD